MFRNEDGGRVMYKYLSRSGDVVYATVQISPPGKDWLNGFEFAFHCTSWMTSIDRRGWKPIPPGSVNNAIATHLC